MKKFTLHINKDITDIIPIQTSSIRCKSDIILCILKIAEIFLLYKDIPHLKQNHNKKIYIIINKMSRVFIEEDRKIVSFYWPFRIDEGNNTMKSSFIEKIDFQILSFLKNILLTPNFISPRSIGEKQEIFEDLYCDFDFDYTIDPTQLWNLLNSLLSMDHGYLRYDYDPLLENKKIHPLHHIDFFYTNSCTFKIGLKKPYSSEDLIDLANVLTNCHYIE